VNINAGLNISFSTFYSTKNKTARIFLCKPLFYLAGVARLELATIGFGDRCSTNWNYTPVDEEHYAKSL
jgi:hypothetical protein